MKLIWKHITDRHSITSSLLMVSILSKLTKKIKLGTLTTNLNFHNPAIVAAMISMADNLNRRPSCSWNRKWC